jgi:RimJ/RimL family protein N-acetyltransferase
MLVQISANRREAIRQLFAGFPGLHGIVDAALEGTMGSIHVDDASQPSLAVVRLDFWLLAGDPRAPCAEDVVREMSPPWSAVTAGEDWAPLLLRIWGDALQKRTRVAFQAGTWDRRRLREFRQRLPNAFTLKRVSAENAARFAEFEPSLVYNFPSLEDFSERGVGFGVEHDGRYVSGCSSFAISSRSIEFEIDTHTDFRNRGLAAACAAAMIEHCLEHGLEPCWDAHNEVSAALATKLGFVEPAPYTAYEVKPGAVPFGRRQV